MIAMSARIELGLEIISGDLVHVRWSGRAAERRPAAALNPVFEKLIELDRNIVFDLSRLEHISSSTMVVVMKFVKRLAALGRGIDVRYDRSVSWQRMTFASLERLAALRAGQLAA
ncbi:hypothetical protein ENSA5_42860 [Enhygromyxa salina]|uniref:STAS domain-containing protein n=1 Tax=Enhygromyxa salina TaxID=215803 RepID=A0A2S9XKM6_9BACT|nr:hypothetical protein [Enhygromyxa salina]PRP93387.1 hypothetical protein ENSA5_42860 [Enhygromyxa salina]